MIHWLKTLRARRRTSARVRTELLGHKHPCSDCGLCLCYMPIRRAWLTTYRVTCRCGWSNHFDFETYPVVARVRSMDGRLA